MNKAGLFCLRIIKIMKITFNTLRQYMLTFSSSSSVITLNNYLCLTKLHQLRLEVSFLLCALSFPSLFVPSHAYVFIYIHSSIQFTLSEPLTITQIQ